MSVSEKQVDRIRELSKEGYSANEIQKQLHKEQIGVRRTVLLTYVREFKQKPPKHAVRKYYPVVRMERKRRAGKIDWGTKRVVIQGYVNGERDQVSRTGTGKDLEEFVRQEMDSTYWDRRPNIISE
jgi:hypothetical protein